MQRYKLAFAPQYLEIAQVRFWHIGAAGHVQFDVCL